MTSWAPQLPDVNPKDWTGVSKPIGDIVADKSTAIAIGAGTDVLNSVVKVTDQTFKDVIKDDVRTGVDRLRDGYTDSLKDLRNQQLAAADPSNQPQTGSSTLLHETNGVGAPMPLQAGLDRAKQLGTAIAQNSNKINDTLYTGSLNSLTKQLRNQYPGYRDYIDEQIQSVSGVNPANAFMKNLMEDINRNQENNKADTNATLSQLRDLNKEGFRDKTGVTAAQVMDLVRSGRITTGQADSWVSSAKTLEWNEKARSDARKTRQENEADAAVNATKDLSQGAAQTIAHSWKTLTIGKGTDTAEGMFKFIQTNSGNSAVMDERSQAMGQQLTALRNATFQAAWEDANKGGENSIVTKLGGDPEKAKKIINGQFATWDLAIEAVYNKDWGAAYSHMNFNKAIGADTTNLLYNAPDEQVRRYNRMVGAINTLSPQYGKDFFTQMVGSDVPQKEKEYVKSLKLELLTQPGKEQGKLSSIQGTIDTAKAGGVTSPKSFRELVKGVDDVSNPKLAEEQRVNIARGFFDPQYNTGLLSDKNFRKDYYDTERKREIPGKYSVFTQLASDKVAGGISELNKAHPELAPMYRGMMSREFGEQLFSRELRDLGQANSGVTPNSLYKIAYVDSKGQVPRFEITGPRGEPLTMTQAIAIRAPVSEINRLNIGISGLHNVYKATGSADPNVDVLGTMYRYGYSDANLTNPKGRTESIGEIPGLIWGALVSAQTERLRKIKDRVKEPE